MTDGHHDIVDPNEWKSRNNKYAGWRDAVYSNQPVNTNSTDWRDRTRDKNDLDSTFKMISKATKNKGEVRQAGILNPAMLDHTCLEIMKEHYQDKQRRLLK